MNRHPVAEPRIGTLMAPASNLVWLDLRDPEAARDKIAENLGAFTAEVVDIDGWRIDKVIVTRTRQK